MDNVTIPSIEGYMDINKSKEVEIIQHKEEPKKVEPVQELPVEPKKTSRKRAVIDLLDDEESEE